MFRPSIQALRAALKPIKLIPRPGGDNEGDPINGDTIFPYLSPDHQAEVRHAEEVLYDYTRTLDGQPDRRSLNTAARNGFPASLDQSPDDDQMLRGRVQVGEWEFDISDAKEETSD